MANTCDSDAEIKALLWEGKPSEARLMAEHARKSAIQRREAGRAEVAAADDEIKKLDSIMPPNWHNDADARISRNSADTKTEKPIAQVAKRARRRLEVAAKLSAAQKQMRALAVIRVAKRIASERGPEIITDDVAKAVAEDGVDMGISPNRVNTAIGNIIGRTDDFEIVRKGVYRWRHPTLQLNDA